MSSNPDEDSVYRDMTCAVCYQSMADLAKEAQAQAQVNSKQKSKSKSKSKSEEQKESNTQTRIEVANQCLSCTSILCHDCLVDWAVASI